MSNGFSCKTGNDFWENWEVMLSALAIMLMEIAQLCSWWLICGKFPVDTAVGHSATKTTGYRAT